MVYVGKESTTRRKFCKRVAAVAISGALVGLEDTARPNPQPETGNMVPAQKSAFLPKTETAEGNNGQEAARDGEPLIAVCGLYCGACPMYLATHHNNEQKRKELLQQFASRQMKLSQEDLQCAGCLSDGPVAVFCRKCAIRLCPANKTNVTRCSDCPDFPCSRITDFNNDGMLHHAEVLDNLRQMREMNIKDWAKHEEELWQCPQCRDSISWYDKACSNCGATRSERLFPLKQG
jgi:hypothetical protein